MDTAIDMSNISIPEHPMEVEFGQWIIDHPDCDTIFERIIGSAHILVYAFSKSKQGNDSLHLYRDENLEGKKILKGVPEYGIRKLI